MAISLSPERGRSRQSGRELEPTQMRQIWTVTTNMPLVLNDPSQSTIKKVWAAPFQGARQTTAPQQKA